MDSTSKKQAKSAAEYEKELDALRKQLAEAHAAAAHAHENPHAQIDNIETLYAVDVDEATLGETFTQAKYLRDDIAAWLNGFTLTDKQRQALNGSGVRRYGFTDKVRDMMVVRPDLTPPYLSATAYETRLRRLEIIRNINAVLAETQRMTTDIMLLYGDEAFHNALMYYGALREATKRHVTGASTLFHELQAFFRRRHPAGSEPTEKEILRDVRAGIHGKKDVDIHIEHEMPHMVGGKHVVVDETHKNKTAWKETESGEVED